MAQWKSFPPPGKKRNSMMFSFSFQWKFYTLKRILWKEKKSPGYTSCDTQKVSNIEKMKKQYTSYRGIKLCS